MKSDEILTMYTAIAVHKEIFHKHSNSSSNTYKSAASFQCLLNLSF